jgi:hypothetical protein
MKATQNRRLTSFCLQQVKPFLTEADAVCAHPFAQGFQ